MGICLGLDGHVFGSKRFGPSEEIPIVVFGQSTDCLCGLSDVVLLP